jgi:hypothetical protein
MRFEWIKADKSRVTVDTSDENGTHYNSKWAANYFVSYYYLRKRSMTKSDMQDALAWLSHFKKRSRDMEDAIIDLRERLEAGGRLDDTTTPTIEASPEAHDVRPVVKKRRMVKDAASGALRRPTSGERWARSLGKGGPEWVETETVELEKVPFPRPTDTQRKTAHIIEARLWDEKVEQGLALKGLKVSNAILKKYGVWPADYPKHDAAAVKARYKQTHILCHPDKNPEIDPDVFPALRAAWEYYFTETGEARVTLGDI